MLEPNEVNRPDFNTLKSKMPPYNDVKTFLAQGNIQGNAGYNDHYNDGY